MTGGPLRVGVVGVGHLGQHHARILAGIEGVALVGVADPRAEQARAVAERCGTAAFTDYRDLLNRVDAVSVAVPTRLHREVAGAFLRRKIPAMVEKPLAASVAEAEELVALAARANVVLQVGHIERFNPALKALDGHPLRPRFLAAERRSTYTFRSTDIGVVLDLMIHDLDLILSLVDAPVAAVTAVGVGVFGDHEDVADARLWFEDGTVATVSASRASYQPARKLRLWGAEGYASLDLAARTGTVIRPSDHLRRGELDLEGVDLSRPDEVRSHLFGKVLRVDQVQPEPCDALTLELLDFVTAVRTGSRPRVTGEDGLRALRLADLILQSLNAHTWDAPTLPTEPPSPATEPIVGLSGPKSWRYKDRAGRQELPDTLR